MKMENKFKLTPYRGDKLRLARLAKGYSLEELGNILNVTRQNIHKMEAGQEPTSEQMPLLCKALASSCPPRRLFLTSMHLPLF